MELARQKLRDRARQLRNEQTDAEAKLWARLRARQISGVKFRRQHPIGPYVADFCCVELRLIIEIDGGQHAEKMQSDQRRTAVLMLINPHPSLSLKGRGLKKMTPSKGL